MSPQKTPNDLRDRLFTAAQAYDRAAQKFWEAAERCAHCEPSVNGHCARHAALARAMSDARRRLLELAHETGVLTMSETVVKSTALIRVVQSPYEGMIVCRDHLVQVAADVIIAHAEIPAAQTAFWGHRCLMCGVDAIPGRHCENEDCGRALHPQWPAIYCCNMCALEDV